MNDRITLGAAVLVAVILAARWLFTPVSEPAPHDDDHDTVVTPIDELMGLWEREQEPVYGIALERARGGRS